jgi:hypothetical protein
MKFKIYKPTKSAMQSGKKNTKKWLLELVEENNIRSVSPITGWISASNTSSQLRFEFSNKEDAVKFAESKNFHYQIEEPKTSSIKKKSYTANFIS